MAARRALVVRGGWAGHVPERATDEVGSWLANLDFQVTLSDDLDSYTDPHLPDFDLIVQCWTMGRITDDQLAGLTAAVTAGTGFAGWHGGIADSFRSRAEYLQLVGAQFVAHPGGMTTRHTLELAGDPAGTGPDVRTGISWPITLETEQYWVLSDDYNDVLATTTLPAGPDTPWRRPITCPAVWTRRWGAGKIFVCTVGHTVADLQIADIRTVVERGMVWAAR